MISFKRNKPEGLFYLKTTTVTTYSIIFPYLCITIYIYHISYMKELALKYGCNPNQKPSRIYMEEGELPITVLSGRPGYINFLDALNSWQLVKELKAATGLPAATSFKHVSPAGAAVGLPLSETLKKIYFVDDVDFELTPLASAYARARGADRMCSYGDFCALSDTCDKETALLIKREVSDGVIAPDYTPEALEILKAKRKGTYNVIKIDPDYVPAPIERKQVFGITFEQGRNEVKLDDPKLFENIPTKNKTFTANAKRDLIISLITLKYTQSNSVCYVADGQAIGIGAGQQSRIHCTRLAGNKADEWWLRQCPKVMNLPFKKDIRRADRDNTINIYISDEYEDVLQNGVWQQFFTECPEPLTREERKEWIAKNTGVALGSDAFFPFGDNIERAHKSGVEYIAQAGGSIRDDHVIDTCDKYNIAMAFTGVRLFHH
ncbi:phosphoribosylaminoimidazolecarboxamide formyltransferase [Prevotella jejuni]|uniref:phosphoribosylaminoimidazolecarboxamide formyltransferase n=1 Tax=Prevotella jejuni TaxID=1177574 RepID=UPI0028EF11A4|nr:phosphoribosylaminoimidazolecarboxamide formyltransferase [Prevotella jejuni]